MRVTVNGQPQQIPQESPTVAELLDFLGMDVEGKGIAVAVNWSVVPRGEWTSLRIQEKDELEVITARQGG